MCLDLDVKNRTKLLSDLSKLYICIFICAGLLVIYVYSYIDITSTPSTALPVTTQNDNSQVAVDLYLAEYTKIMPGRYLQPGWIGSVNVSHNNTITYGDVKKLIYNCTELEVGIF